jgi:hypothetical protein
MSLPPVHGRSNRNWNQQTFIVECALQRSLACGADQTADLSQRLNAFRPPPFKAAMDAKRIFGTHQVNLADTLQTTSWII